MSMEFPGLWLPSQGVIVFLWSVCWLLTGSVCLVWFGWFVYLLHLFLVFSFVLFLGLVGVVKVWI